MKGYKTYLIALAMGIATAMKFLGYLDQETYLTIMGLLGGGGFAALRAGVKKEGMKGNA